MYFKIRATWKVKVGKKYGGKVCPLTASLVPFMLGLQTRESLLNWTL